VEIVAGQGGYQGKADFTSAYTDPHIIIIDGRTKAVEAMLGEPDYLELGLQAALLGLTILLLAGVSYYAKRRRDLAMEAELEGLREPVHDVAGRGESGGEAP